MIRSGMGIAASAMLLVLAAPGAHAQRAASWPTAGARLVRVEDVPATATTTRLRRAVGDYARIEPKGETLSTRILTVDCVTSRVRPHGAAR